MREQTVREWGYQCACRRDDCLLQPWRELQIHEEPPRSKGGDPLDPLDCLPLTAGCHRKRTGELRAGLTLRITIANLLRRCRGPVVFTDMVTGDHWVTIPETFERYPDVPTALAAQARAQRR